jgi:hypothetical protein
VKASALHRAGAALLPLLLLLSDCPLSRNATEGGAVPGEDGEQRSDLFVLQAGSPGRYVFLTNDPGLWGPYGYTLWTLTGACQRPFVSRELQLQKVSGDDSAGFGAVLCHEHDGLLGDTMLVLLINTRRQYTIGEVCGTQFRYLVSWSECPALLAGSALNRLRIERDGEAFRVFFNGLPACSFLDEEAPLHSQGEDGLLVVISPQDRFPKCPVHVVFQELSP